MPIYTRSQRIASLRGRAAATASSRSSTNAESWQRNTGLAHAWALVQETNTVGTEQITAPPTNPTSVAAAAPLTQSKRTRSQRTTAATADTSIATKPSTAVVAAVVSTNTKKARFSKSEPQQQPRTYKLRSSAALADSPDDDIASATAVTPGTVTRQINFETNAADDDDTESVFSDSSADILPMGVVNIFAKWDKAAGCVAKSKAVSGCSCCHTNHQETLQILASQHLSEYGSEYCQEMQTKEARELQILQRIEPLLPPQPLLLDATSAETRLQQQRRRFNSAAALDEDSDSTVDATAAATQTRRRRSLALESRKSDNHARETASATTSTEAAISMTVNRLNETEPLPNQPLLTAKMRRVLVQWMSEVGQEYKLSEATYHLAVTLLDIVLTLGPTRQEFFETQVVPPQQQHVIVGYGCGDDDDPAQSNKLLIQRNDFQALGWYVLTFL